jgi:hypothetical protein
MEKRALLSRSAPDAARRPMLGISVCCRSRRCRSEAGFRLRAPEWLRALACFDNGRCTLVSRNGNAFKSFPDLCEDMGRGLAVRDAVLDGEIVCLDRRGRSVL